ncbi:pseudouridylate synthase [Ectothiorhodospiraceae bacterium WFHF3C12]|nr:pseudouridylate synthase [Ectothiorhodospiraceae bacterium WFHF3C12]
MPEPVDWHLPVVYRDEQYVVVDKPSGMLVHRTALDPERDVALQRVRDQLGRRVYPVHRLDRPTSGLLAFALDPAAAEALAEAFRQRGVEKRYLAVVRGWTPQDGEIDRPLRDKERGVEQPALTRYRRLATVELPIPVSRYPAARYSLLEIRPATGRHHQIRRHLSGISHPLIGDTTHGKGAHNRLFRQHFDVHRLLLRAAGFAFIHPYNGRRIELCRPWDETFRALCVAMGWAESVQGAFPESPPVAAQAIRQAVMR